MSGKLKKFINAHRQEFDTNEPNKGLWKKIDAQMEVKNSSRISSNWLSKFKQLAFSASVLVIAVYFIAKYLNNYSANEPALNKKDSAISPAKQSFQAHHNKPGLNSSENNITKEPGNLTGNNNKPAADNSKNPLPASLNNTKEHIPSAYDSLLNVKNDSVLNINQFEAKLPGQKKTNPESSANHLHKAAKPAANYTHEKKETGLTGKTKKTELYIPDEPGEMNSYTGTLYDGSSFCAMLHAYKFPGKVMMKDGDFRKGSKKKKTKGVLRTMSCDYLADMTNIKAIWLKGKTDKALRLSIEKKFKNMLLVKSDGRKIRPEAISHYYQGRGVITEYTGKYLNMVFKDKVELILFFKDAKAGDKIVIDGIIEAVVKDRP